VIISHNYYYAHPGDADAVLRQRLKASAVRERIGLPRGRVMRKVQGADALPDVVWEIEFEDLAGHHADMAARAASAEFEAVRNGMRRLYRRFARPLFEPLSGAGWRAGGSEVVLAYADAAPEAAAAPAGGRLLRLLPGEAALPPLLWQADAGADCGVLERALPAGTRIEHGVWRLIESG
jgi:hypothetical protein